MANRNESESVNGIRPGESSGIIAESLLQVVGEGSVLLQLTIRLLSRPEWRVFKNCTEAGCDLVILHNTNYALERQSKIGVKTRHNLVTGRRNKNGIHFTLSQAERDASDFLVAYWLDRNDFFVVPCDELRAVNNGNKKSYKFIAYVSTRSGEYTEHSARFLNRWDSIVDALDK